MDGSTYGKRFRVVLRFEGIGPKNLAGYEKHRKRVGGDIGHILKNPPAPNSLLIGDEDWAAKALGEIAEMKAQNFAAELEALQARKRKKDIQKRLAEGPHDPWRPTRHGPMREVILTVNKDWFNADPAAVFDEGVGQNQRITDFERLSIEWLRENFGNDVIHARADHDEEAYHIHAVIMPQALVEMTRKDKATGEKKVIATRRMLQPSKFDLIEDYELAQDSVGDWFSQIGLERGKKRKAAFREAIANGQTPPPKRLHTNTRDWRRKKDRELAKRARDLDGRAEVIQEKSAEADAIIAVTEAISQGVVDPADLSAGKPIRAVKGRENDPEFKRTLRHARRSPKGVARVTKAFGSGWSAMFKRAQEKAFKQVSDDFKSAAQTLKDVTERLSNVVPAFGKGLPDDVKSLPELVHRLKKAIARGQIGHGISERKQHKNNELDDL